MKTYRNPIKKHGDFADPFVLRYNGRYYLYCTNPGVKCWSSADLVNWHYEREAVAEDEFPGLVPFAPEVVYANGSFYMYTSPHGRGHYVLQSDSPLGPFRKVTPNVAHSIDFSVFVDTDGKWYAYWADDAGIMGCEMPTPTTFGTPQNVGVWMHGWTEGPFVVKRDGRYHLTYTGNHYLSKGYRVHEAISDSPLSGYKENPRNPILICTQGDTVGLGHSCTVKGPDLCGDYIIYHNLNPDHSRDLNIARVLHRPQGAYVLGPTIAPQPCPALPEIADATKDDALWEIEEGCWTREGDARRTSERFSAMCRAALPDNGAAECWLGGKGAYELTLCKENAVWRIAVHGNTVSVAKDGQSIINREWTASLHTGALHCIRVETGGHAALYFDQLLLAEIEERLHGARIGIFGESPCFVGCVTLARSTKPVYPIPCMLDEAQSYLLNVPKTASYTVAMREQGALTLDGRPLQAVQATKTPYLARVSLPAGCHELEAPSAFEIYETPCADTFTAKASAFGPYAKQISGKAMDTLALCASLTLGSREHNWQAGVLFHASQLADGGEGDDPVLGTNFFLGYRVGVQNAMLCLWRHRYDEALLASAPADVPDQCELRVRVSGGYIEATLNGDVALTYTDPLPILCGMAGFHARGCVMNVASLTVSNEG